MASSSISFRNSSVLHVAIPNVEVKICDTGVVKYGITSIRNFKKSLRTTVYSLRTDCCYGDELR
jgi:hypothetical protein